MDNDHACRIIHSLASGIDPFTGEVFPSESLFHQPKIIRALFLAATALQGKDDYTKLPKQKSGNLPINTGRAWSEIEEQRLVKSFESGSTVLEIAARHEHTPGSIRSRLIKRGNLLPLLCIVVALENLIFRVIELPVLPSGIL